MGNAMAIALAVPGCLVGVATAIGLVMTVFGQSPMWPHQPVNLAEAAGVYDEAAMVRLIEDGMDPDARYPIRPGLIFGYQMNLTPLEAAVANDDPAMVTRLVEKGATLDARVWTHLRCIADGERVLSKLDELRPAGAAEACEGVVKPWKDD
jgi:hypothetical protein